MTSQRRRILRILRIMRTVLIRGTFNGLFGEVVGSGGEGGGLGDEV